MFVPIVDSAQRWTLNAGAFALPLAFLPTLVDGLILPKLLAARLLVLLLGVLWLVRGVADGRLWVRRTPLDLPLLAFLGSAILSSLFATNQTVALFGTYRRYEGLFTLLTYVGLFWLTVQTLATRQSSRGVVRSLMVGAYLAALLAILQSIIASVLGGGQGGESFATFGGIIRASGTLGNANLLGVFLAMVLPLAVDVMLTSREFGTRLLGANLVVVMTVALVLTFSRSAWLGAGLGLLMLLATQRRRTLGVAIGAAVLLLVGLGVVVATLHQGGLPVARSAIARAASLADPAAGSGATRLHIWKDTIGLIASRPLIGYGPDSFGLAFPHFQTGDWAPGLVIDKAHAELLQVAATQGLIGAGIALWIMVATLVTFWNGRAQPGAVALFAGWVAYQVPDQLNFSWLPAAAPFWMFLGAAVATWTEDGAELQRVLIGTPFRVLLLAATAALAVAVLVAGVIRPYQADAQYLSALAGLQAGNRAQATRAIAAARRFAPEQSVYAAAAGDIALGIRRDDTPAADADWSEARADYDAASSLGTFFPATFRRLAIADQGLGLRSEAIAAARRAVELNRFDQRNQRLLAQLES